MSSFGYIVDYDSLAGLSKTSLFLPAINTAVILPGRGEPVSRPARRHTVLPGFVAAIYSRTGRYRVVIMRLGSSTTPGSSL